MTDKILKIYTDGACSGNPGKGGWGAILIYKNKEKRISGNSKDTTNNRMELQSVIEALKIIKNNNDKIEIYSDSKYVIDGITKWIHKWKEKGWMKGKTPPKNLELWKELDLLSSKYNIEWNWIKGHSGNKYNEIADKLATLAINKN